MRRYLLPSFVALYTGVGLYYRYRPLPKGINGPERSYDVPAEDITFLYDATWYENDTCCCIRQITDDVIAIIERARCFVVMDVFLFNLHHTSDGTYIPTTRQIADAFGEKKHPAYFITDPLNTSYGTTECEPLTWLRQAGVAVCLTNLRRLRDNNLLYSPLWRLFLQWFDTGRDGQIENPLRKGKETTLRALLEALNARGNHRKVVVADDDDSYVTLVTSSNFEDASCFFPNTALKIRSQAVARHFLAAEKAVARMSGCDLPVDIPACRSAGDARVTPLMGRQIKRELLRDLQAAESGDELFVFILFLSDRDVIRALAEGARNGVRIVVVLDPNKVSFGEPKSGYPNRFVATELANVPSLEVRWANSGDYEFHTKFVLLKRKDSCIMHTGSANLTRRSLSGTNPEANVRVEAPVDAGVSRDALAYARETSREPRSVPFVHHQPRTLRYWNYRFQEATGMSTF